MTSLTGLVSLCNQLLLLRMLTIYICVCTMILRTYIQIVLNNKQTLHSLVYIHTHARATAAAQQSAGR